MPITHVRRTHDGKDPTLTAVKAQVAFRLVRGDTIAELMGWFRREYPAETLDLLYAALDEAERHAEYARRYNRLKKTDKLGDIR